ncbi:hypothetical protein PF008_g114 [Phytophthora fragariae]|uniref:Uncharacterized protein n=1 Tax=Phytophthora fragariae TaxID=53985 RepID=A0A6G0SPA2_9STRA|nr:hypothetical protein PF008_g114 [Phytophthora fragariae]
MVFTSLSTTVADIVLLGKVSIIGARTALIFTTLSSIASMLSLTIAMLFRGLHPLTKGVTSVTSSAFFSIMCENGSFLTYNATGRRRARETRGTARLVTSFTTQLECS